jgi:hypothetical protein
VVPNEDDFRVAMREVVARSGRSMRALSAEMGRDPGYVAALLDPSRPSRARPTPADLVAASDATGISFVELLEILWGIDPARLAGELAALGVGPSLDERLAGFTTPNGRAWPTTSPSSPHATFVAAHRTPDRRTRSLVVRARVVELVAP